MKTGRLNLRLSENRLNKLRLYAQSKEKTVTQLIEDWIDRLPNTKIGDSDALYETLRERGLANAALSLTPLPDQPSG